MKKIIRFSCACCLSLAMTGCQKEDPADGPTTNDEGKTDFWQDCVDEGVGFENFNTEGVCCAGLTPVTDSELIDGTCTSPRCPCYVCTDCGDGDCGEGENWCNCPDDCCLGQGREFEGATTEGVCCEGLEPISASVPQGDGCSTPRCLCFVCANCGNGDCEAGENECNCDADCP